MGVGGVRGAGGRGLGSGNLSFQNPNLKKDLFCFGVGGG